ELIAEMMKKPGLNVRMLMALATALARLDGRGVNEGELANYFVARVLDDKASADQRRQALRLVPLPPPKLTLALLENLVGAEDAALRLEAMRALAEHPSPMRAPILLEEARSAGADESLRAQAVAALAEKAEDHVDDLLSLRAGKTDAIFNETLRALIGVR